MSVGNLDLTSGIDEKEIRGLLLSSPFKVVIVRIEEPTDNDREVMSHIVPMIDYRVVYVIEVNSHLIPQMPSMYMKYDGPLTQQIIELAYASGQYSRFNLDPGFQPHFKRLYRTWIEGSINGRLADTTFVHFIADKPVGLATIKNAENEADIGLLAVNKEYRQMGIGKYLINCVKAWCVDNHCDRIKVATQTRNLLACKFYEKQGFTCERCYGIYHVWKG